MEYVTLGKTGLKISKLGFGGIPIQKTDVTVTKNLIKAMVEKGINYIDTARGYTVSEAFLGEALEGYRDKFILATKSMAVTKEAMAADIETSLRNLRTDHIELYQVHNPSLADLQTLTAPGGALEALLEAKASGKIGHIGLYRDPETHEPVEYYCKLPEDIGNRVTFVVDPMLATGGSAVAAIDFLKKHGCRNIIMMNIIGCPEGIRRVQEAHPDVEMYLAACDEKLNDHAYIVPGLGDAGDRIFGTK